MDFANSYKEIELVNQEYLKINNSFIPTVNKVLKIGIVGEIYTILEPYLNSEIDKKLNRLNIYTERLINISSWLKSVLNIDETFNFSRKSALKESKRYVAEQFGGEGAVSVGGVAVFAKNGFHGVIHLAPFSCMPELIAQKIMAKVAKEHNIDLISLYFDEHFSETGFQTRIEAFVDMLNSKYNNSHEKSISN